jgi:transcriptional regulator with XRE-family HTH domain
MAEDARIRVGRGIRRARERKGWTQTELARAVLASDAQVSRWENGRAVPRIETLEQIAAILDTTIDEFFRQA